jgi:rhodanese-related sulfurtransferase
MHETIDASGLKEALHDGGEIALLDVREHGEYGEAHLFYGVSLPYSRFEIDLERLVPRPDVRLVLHDDGRSGIAGRAARRAAALGYCDVAVLAGGTAAWAAAGYHLFAGVNVVSKAFGEIAEHAYHTPSISAEDLHARLARGDDVVVLDGRPVDEYRKMNIPGSICCPNGELVHRARALVPDRAATVVINCAGRTRSIIGAQTLRNFGLPNEVMALRNGTMGWRLAGFELEHGSARLYPASVDPAIVEAARAEALDAAARWGVPRVEAPTVAGWLREAGRTTYVLDVRTPEEFEEAHLPGAVHAPGGQLVQATDQWLAVRGARVVLVDDTEVRAIATAHWLRQMGWDAAVLAGGRASWPALDGAVPVRNRAAAVLPGVARIDARDLPNVLARPDGAHLVDIRPGMAYRAGHVAGARWAIRPAAARLAADLPAGGQVVLMAGREDAARAFAADLEEAGVRVLGFVPGGPDDWTKAGLNVVSTPSDPPDADCIDYLFFVHDRHDGNLDAARRYLSWETGLLAQIDECERAGFRIPEAAQSRGGA